MAKQEVVVIYDRKKVAAKRGKGKVEVRVYISRTTRVRDKKRLEKVGNLVKNSYLYR